MVETLNRQGHPEHFDVHHENGEALMCMSSGGVCRVLVEVMAGYTPEEEQQLIASTTNALEAIDQYTGGKAADIFTGLHIKIGEDVAEGGAKAVAEENQVLLNGRKMLLSVAEMQQVSGAYSDEELAGFPDEQRPGGALEYTLVHEIGHVLDGQTKTGEAYHRVAASESSTTYGREADEWHSDNKDHEAFAEGFAHAVYGMPISETMETTVRETIDARLQEITENQADPFGLPEEFDLPEIDDTSPDNTLATTERSSAAEAPPVEPIGGWEARAHEIERIVRSFGYKVADIELLPDPDFEKEHGEYVAQGYTQKIAYDAANNKVGVISTKPSEHADWVTEIYNVHTSRPGGGYGMAMYLKEIVANVSQGKVVTNAPGAVSESAKRVWEKLHEAGVAVERQPFEPVPGGSYNGRYEII